MLDIILAIFGDESNMGNQQDERRASDRIECDAI